MPLSPGQVLNNRYRIVRLLGQGGFGAVSRDLETSAQAQEQFVREARLLFKLQHPSLPRAFDHFTIPAQGQYLVMDYVEGENLKDITQKRRLSPDEALGWIGQICDALIYMHACQPPVIHRDIKPENIKITPQGKAVLVDFGIAKLFDPTTGTRTGARAYTPGYAPPEQHSGTLTDVQSDIYSLGATAYTLLTGLVPPDTSDILAGLKSPPPPANQVNPQVPLAVSKAVEHAMQLKRSDRPLSVAAFKAALFSPQAAPPSPPPSYIYVPATVQAPVAQPPVGAGLRPAQAPMAPPAMAPANKRPVWLFAVLGLVALGVLAAAFFIFKGMSGDGEKEPSATAPGALPGTEVRAATVVFPTVTQPLETTLGIGSAMVSDVDGMVMVYVPGGPFVMGGTADDALAECQKVTSECQRDDYLDEEPPHTVTLDAFWIDQTEVTNAMYAACVADGACQPPANTGSYARSAYYDDPQYADYPVIYVTWNDADGYCRWAGRRLPTEAEWEKAARGDDGRTYPWGTESPSGDLANSCDQNCTLDWKDANFDDGYEDTAPVGSYPAGASPYGALDMAGNVWEWVKDWYQWDYYSVSPPGSPYGPESGSGRVLRGGSWDNSWYNLRVSYRGSVDPAETDDDVGFRCAVSP